MPSNPFIGSPFIELRTVDSTNNYAMGLAREGMARHGTVVFAHSQTKGKGQRNRQWDSEGGQNIALSAILEPQGFQTSELFLLSMAIAVAASDLLNTLLAGDCRIKWPNDLYWRDRKAGGILIENIWSGGQWKYAVAGIGINVNQTVFEGLESKAVSIRQVTGQSFEPLALAGQLCESLDGTYRQLLKNPQPIIDRYSERLYKKGETVTFKKGDAVFHARILEVTTDGKLLVQRDQIEAFEVGEVEWIIR